MTEARVPVTVEDREVYLALGIFHTCEDRMILAGWADESPEMQRIARHRLAGVAAGREEACKAFEHRIAEGYDIPARKADHCIHGRFGWEDCIACYDDTLEDTIAAIRQMGGE